MVSLMFNNHHQDKFNILKVIKNKLLKSDPIFQTMIY